MTFSRLHLAVLLCALAGTAAGLRAQDTIPLAAPTAPITLGQAIRMALAQNSSVCFAQSTTKLDSLTVRQLHNDFLPNLSASSQTAREILNGGGRENAFSVSGGISSGVTIYNGGQNVNALRQAQLFAGASAQDLGRARQTVVFDVAADFLDLITQQEQLLVAQTNLTAQADELTQIQAFTDAGTRPIGDLYQQQAAVASTRLAVANARHGTELAKVNLIQELLLDPRGTYTFVTPATGAAAPVAPVFDLDSLITVALAQRADVQAESLRVEAARRELQIAAGARLPVVSASGGYSSGYNSTADGSFLAQLNQRRGGSVGLGVTIPIFDRGAASIAVARAQIQLDDEALRLRDVKQTVAVEVRRALLDFQVAEEQLTESNEQQRAAALALEAAQARYRAGVSTLVEVTLARATLIQAQSAVVNARSSVAFQRALMSYYTGELGEGNAPINR